MSEKKAKDEKCPSVGGDPSAFSLLPMAGRPSAPKGQTPMVRVTWTRDHLLVMGGSTPEGTLMLHMHD
jgi:hypothetical protein